MSGSDYQNRPPGVSWFPLGCLALIVVLSGGCWWLSRFKASPPPGFAAPESFPTIPPAALELIDSLNKGVDSMKKRFTPKQREELSREFIQANRKSEEKALRVFQKKHALSEQEMSALSSGAIK